jgi:hypothetical protein
MWETKDRSRLLPDDDARLLDMGSLEEIEQAIEKLPPEEFLQTARWVREREQRHWDERLDSDSAAGKLDFLFEEAEEESKAGRPR